jgi:hypothetical protein
MGWAGVLALEGRLGVRLLKLDSIDSDTSQALQKESASN